MQRRVGRRPSALSHCRVSAARGEYRLPRSLMSTFFTSQHMPCAECGASVHVSERERHTCDPERRLEYRIFQLRDEVATFHDRLGAYLESPQGRFAQWLAERERQRGD